MKIAILAWGSLIWDKRSLSILGDWQKDGPILPIEFSRISGGERLTLVIDPQNGAEVVTHYAQSGESNLNKAIVNLMDRENIPLKDRIGFINLANNTEREWSREHHPLACDRILTWAKANGWDAVIWTALTPNFHDEKKLKRPFSVELAIEYVLGLSGPTKANAIAYIRNAPPEVSTPFRLKFNEYLAQTET